jgi:serine/threonine protein kinase
MEYVDGTHIDVYCRERNLAIPERLRLFLKVCEAVSRAHNNGIVHRDLKPANILVDRDGSPRLIDFGIAKMLDANLSQALTVRGLEVMTLLYASPERLSGDSDLATLPSSDIYSLGGFYLSR